MERYFGKKIGRKMPTFLLSHGRSMSRLFYGAIAGAVILIGCGPSYRVTREFYDPEFRFGKMDLQSTVRVVVSGNIMANEYYGPVQDVYQNPANFRHVMQKQIADSVTTMVKCRADTSDDVAGGDHGFNLPALRHLTFKPGDLVLSVTCIDISNKLVIEGPVEVSNSTASGMIGNGGYTMKCRVVIYADVWVARSRQKVLTYYATGETTVSGSKYGSALQSSCANAITSLVGYLGTGKN